MVMSWSSLDTAGFRPMLQAPLVARSAHFVVHHSNLLTQAPAVPASQQVVQGFSTDLPPSGARTVDNSVAPRVLGVMVPKRHAKRAVTRNLVKRLVRAVWQAPPAAGVSAPHGAWLVRLRQPIDRQVFPSARSDALRQALRTELQELFAQALRQRPSTAAQ
jgi:ribonuclease P protein component